MNHLQSTLPKASTILQTPIRQHHSLCPSSSLLMPSWSSSPSLPYIGVKLVTHFPQNSSINLPGVQGSYVLFSSTTGQTLASMDSTELTLYRTSCFLGTASDQSPSFSHTQFEKSHHLEQNSGKGDKFGQSGEFGGVSFDGCGCLDEVVGFGDIVSCATNSETSLVKGVRLKGGAHLDLVGSFKPSMMECDDEAIRRGKVFVDNEAALVEAGELVGAFERGVIKRDEIGGSLVELVRGDKVGRSSSEQICLRQFVYETYTRS
ncbi:Protein SAR DEFICIENT 4 [Glycine soja]